MNVRVLRFIPVIFALAGGLLILISGKDVEFIQRNDTVSISKVVFVAAGVLVNAGLFLLYRWFLQRKISRSLFVLHLLCAFPGMAIFVYLLLPFNDGGSLDDMLVGLSWLMLCALLVMIGFISLVILTIRRARATV